MGGPIKTTKSYWAPQLKRTGRPIKTAESNWEAQLKQSEGTLDTFPLALTQLSG